MPNRLDQIVNGLVGVAFGVRAFDSRRPIWARIAYAGVGVDLLKAAYQGDALFQGLGRSEKLVQGQAMRTATGDATVPLKFEKVQLRSGNIGERVAYVHKQAVAGAHDPQVYALARAVVSRKCGDEWCIRERDHEGEASALFREARARVRYTLDPLWYDSFQTPSKTLALHTGDCDDSAALLGAMLMTIGLQVRSVVVQTTGFDTFNHIFLAVQLPGKGWMPLDPTVDKPAGWEVPASAVIVKKQFLITEKGLPKLSGEK